MQDATARLILDVQDSSNASYIHAKQGDTARQILITLSDGGFPYVIGEDCTAVLNGVKPDKTKIFSTCEISGNEIAYTMTPQTTAVPGKVQCEVRVYGPGDKLLTSARFRILVDAELDGEPPVSEDEVTALTSLISEVTDAIGNANQAAEAAGNAAADLLERAENGEFDGKPGEPGAPGKTPVKGVDYFDGQDYILTEADKHEIAGLIPGTDVHDVTIGGTSVLSNGVASIPVASTSAYGAVKVSSTYGTRVVSGNVGTYAATEAEIAAGTHNYKPIVPKTVGYAVKTGMTSGAEWTEEEKQAARNKIGVKDATNVTFEPNQSSGALVGTLTIDGNATSLYAPDYDDTAIRAEMQRLDNAKADKTALALANRKIDALIKVNEGQNYWFETVESTADTVTVPSGAKAASLNMLGGMSRRGFNLANNRTGRSSTVNGIAYTSDDDGVWHFQGTTTARSSIRISEDIAFSAGQIYTLSGCPAGGGYNQTYALFVASASSLLGVSVVDNGNGITFTPAKTGVAYLNFNIEAGMTIDFDLKPMLVAGTSAMDFEPYTEKLLNAPVDQIITTAEEKAIPQSVIDLCPDYGCGLSSTIYNYIDFENKKYYHNVGSVDLGTLAWAYLKDYPKILAASIVDRKIGQANVLMGRYNYAKEALASVGDKTYRGQASGDKLYIRDDSFTDADIFKASMSGMMLNYELTVTEVIDLSAVLPDDWNILEVTAGNSVQFHYPNKDNGFTLDVPSTMEYGVKLKEVVFE